MSDPLTSLLIVVAVLALATLTLWPDRGLWWHWRRGLLASRRMQVEDALKHLWDGEYHGRAATVQSLAGALRISPNHAAALATELQESGLASSHGGGLHLTEAARASALRLVRTHRLIERYLSERTGVEPTAWHPMAELLEHYTSAEQAEAMAARLGHPLWDPHGDPIPSPSGELPPPTGVPLTELAAGSWAQIVHIEDEPRAVYVQLVALDLAPGVDLRLAESSSRRLRIEVGANEHYLAPVVAANLTVRPIEGRPITPSGQTLVELSTGQRAVVIGLSPACHGAERRRLLDLGVVPGTTIEAELEAPGGDPVAYRIRGSLLALRRVQAERILVRSDSSEAER